MITLTIVRNDNLKWVSIFIIWLFQITAMLGISIGYYDWFISKTPLNLILSALLLCIHYPINNYKGAVFIVSVCVISFFIEWIGVHYGFLFGIYEYGANLGIKLDGVPVLIGINWAILLLSTAAIADRLVNATPVKILLGASLMVFMDFFIETSAPPFDFWTWASGAAPLRNFIGWFAVSLFLHFGYHKVKMKGNFNFACHLYLAQLIFFIYFYGFHQLK
jgi:uncharacterized membrane protein